MHLISSKHSYGQNNEYRWESILETTIESTMDFRVAEKEIFKELHDYVLRHQVGNHQILNIFFDSGYYYKVCLAHERGIFE